MTRRRRSIVHAIARLNVGGAALHVIQLAAEQARRGDDVLVVAGTLAGGEESMEYAAHERDVPIRSLPALQRELSARGDVCAVRELRRIVCERRPDVLHTHTAKAGATGRIAALTLGRARPAAVVHTFHGHVLRGYFDPRRERAFRQTERLLAHWTDALVAVSAEVRDDLVALGAAPRRRFVVIPYGFELESGKASDSSRASRRAELGIADDAFVAGWAGRLTDIKRPLDLVNALHETIGRGVDAVLVVVGDGTERGATEQRARELGVLDRCRFVGFQRRIDEWYACFDALLLTSENEGTPVVAIEALAAGKPVVATDAGGTATVVRNDLSGFLVPIGDVAALGERLARLATDPALRERLGRYGAADMHARFATTRMADDIDRLYQTIIER